MNGIEYHFARDGRRFGPVSVEQLQREEVTRQTLVWRKGLAEWTAAGRLAELQSMFELQPPPLPSAATATRSASTAASPLPKAPWKPETIALVSILCTPLWGGVMTAINARRLGLSTPWWRPVGVGAVYLLLDSLFGSLLGDSYLVSLLLHLGSIGALWVLDLDGQAKQFKDLAVGSVDEGKWLAPGLAGAPLALLVIIYFVVMPFAPLQPMEVCKRLIHATTETEYGKYATLKLQPALIALSKLEESGNPDYEILGEVESDVGGRLVGYRLSVDDKGQNQQMEGFFHLLELEDGWRVDEMYISSFDGQELSQPLPLSANYHQIVFSAGLEQLSKLRSSTSSSSGGTSIQSLVKKPFAWLFGWRFLVLIGMGAAALLKSVFGTVKKGA